MNKSRLCKGLVGLLCVIGTTAYGQKETKTYKEVFNVSPETILDINTSNADIEFETWAKDQIEVEATIEIDGATTEEAQEYFENGAIEIIGNSQKISVKTKTGNTRFLNYADTSFNFPQFDNGLRIQINDLSDHLSNLGDELQWVDLSVIEEMPPMPPIPHTNFDYEAFEKDGEKYMKKWQKEFRKGFGKEYQERMEEWTKKHEAHLKKREELIEQRQMERKKRMEERGKRLEKLTEKREERAAERAERMIIIRQRREDAAERRKNMRIVGSNSRTDSVQHYFFSTDSSHTSFPNSFYFSSGGRHKNFKIKKTIKIKMPKANKMKMNVRHGEVKLAANTKNMEAKLSYSNLRAFIIDGKETTVVASYSPVSVQKWNLGQLRAEYSEAVNLEEVVDLRLTATSSDVTIDRLLDKAYIKNDYGPLTIHTVSNAFSDLDISLQNAELECGLPETAFAIYVNGTSSKISTPSKLELIRTENGNNTVHKGFYRNKDTSKNIVINSKYSEVTIK